MTFPIAEKQELIQGIAKPSDLEAPSEGRLMEDMEWVLQLVREAYGKRYYGKLILNYTDGVISHIDNHAVLKNPKRADRTMRGKR